MEVASGRDDVTETLVRAGFCIYQDFLGAWFSWLVDRVCFNGSFWHLFRLRWIPMAAVLLKHACNASLLAFQHGFDTCISFPFSRLRIVLPAVCLH